MFKLAQDCILVLWLKWWEDIKVSLELITEKLQIKFKARYEATIHILWLRNFVSGLWIVETITKPQKFIVIKLQQYSSPRMISTLNVSNIWNYSTLLSMKKFGNKECYLRILKLISQLQIL